MAEQLLLVDPEPRIWRIDEGQRRAGLEGVQAARIALREAIARAESRRAGSRKHGSAAA